MTQKVILHSKKNFLWILRQEMYRVERTNQPLSLLLLEVSSLENMVQNSSDNSKHLTLDVLTKMIEENFRKTDIRGWYDKDVLAILMPNTTKSGALIANNKLKEAIINSLKDKDAIHCEVVDKACSIYTYPDSLIEENSLLSSEDSCKEDELTQQDKNPYAFHQDILNYFKKSRFKKFIKRLFDIVVSALALLSFLPVIMVIAIIIKLTSPGPIFFKQIRLGYCGKPFTFYKFRSMYHCSDDKRHREYVAKLIKGEQDKLNMGSKQKPILKLTDDARITPFGFYLRRSSLDELPQLFNVLLGDMSLIGPRPPIPYEVESYNNWHLKRILEVKPGITGLWQVLGRSRTTFDEMVRLDIKYVENWSFIMDMKILFMTIDAVLSARGAH